MNLSTAIRAGAPLADGFTTGPYNCPLGAAYLGTLSEAALPHFWNYCKSVSDEALCSTMLRSLHRAFPHLGQTVRSWPRLAGELEQRGLLPRARPYQVEYRREIHKSLWQLIADLHVMAWSKTEIADFLGGHGL